MKNNYLIGFMQGRIVGSEDKNFIQFFPSKKWKDEFKLAKKNDFQNIELTANLENLDKNPVFNELLLKNYLFEKRKNKIKADSLTCDFFMQKPFFKLDKENSLSHKKILEKIIINGQKIGIKKFILPLVDNSSVKNKNQEKKIIEYFTSKNFKKILLKKTLILFESNFPPMKLFNFIKKFKSKKFGINYDSGNSAALNYKFKDETIYFNYVKNIHIKDRHIYGKTVDLGKGNANLYALANYIKRKKYKGNLILQTAIPKKRLIQKLISNKKYFNNFL